MNPYQKIRELCEAMGIKPTEWQTEFITAAQEGKTIAPIARRSGLSTIRKAMEKNEDMYRQEYLGEFPAFVDEAAVWDPKDLEPSPPAPQCAPGELPPELREDYDPRAGRPAPGTYFAPLGADGKPGKYVRVGDSMKIQISVRNSSKGFFTGSKIIMAGTPIASGSLYDPDDDDAPAPPDTAVGRLPGPPLIDRSKYPKPTPKPNPRPHPKPYRSTLDSVSRRAAAAMPARTVDLDAVFGVQSKRA